MEKVDIIEQKVYEEYPGILEILLRDHTTNHNIVGATDNYTSKGKEFAEDKEIKIELITGQYSNIIQPRVSKSKYEQEYRTKDKAEVFTPTGVCKEQNNLIDKEGFNDLEKLSFMDGKNGRDYVSLNRLEICCGEAPYITNRYDAVTGEHIAFPNRIGFLDRKLIVVDNMVNSRDDWKTYAQIAYKSCYGYDFQGDNVLIARENLFCSFIDAHINKFNEKPSKDDLISIANIISWNIWQMDGLRNVTPYSRSLKKNRQTTLFDLDATDGQENYESTKSKIYNGEEDKEIYFEKLINKAV